MDHPSQRRDWVEPIVITALVLVFLAAAALISDWNASRGIFYYHHHSYHEDRAAQSYCNSPKNVFLKDQTSDDSKTESERDADHKKYDS